MLQGTRSGFADKATIGGLRYLTGAINRDLAPNAMATTDTRPRELFQSGKLAMYNGLPNDSDATYKDPRVRARTGIAVLPRGREPATVIHGPANAINARTPYPDACYEFPLALDTATATATATACSAAGVQLYPGHVVRYFAEYEALQRAVAGPRSARSRPPSPAARSPG